MGSDQQEHLMYIYKNKILNIHCDFFENRLTGHSSSNWDGDGQADSVPGECNYDTFR